MTSEHLMRGRRMSGSLSGIGALGALAMLAVVMSGALSACGFNKPQRFVTPSTLDSPYAPDRAVTVWAVSPMRNMTEPVEN